jgi:hypothetical protein
MFKKASQQVSPWESGRPERFSKGQISDVEAQHQVSDEEKRMINERARKRMQELEAELEKIKKDKQTQEMQRKLVDEETSKKKMDTGKPEPLPEVASKRPRGLFAGIVGRVKRLARKTETRLPPTG